MSRHSMFRRIALPLAAAALLVATRAFADGAPPPDPPPPPPPLPPLIDTTAIGFIEHVRIGTPPCNTCPPRVCPGEPIQVTISGNLPSPCFRFLGFRDVPVDAIGTLLVADFAADTCATGCPAVLVPFSASVSLRPEHQLSNAFTLRHQVYSCPDTLAPPEVLEREYTYRVEQDCSGTPPVDSLVRTFVAFEVLPKPSCDGDSLTLLFRENGCPPCVFLTSLTHDSTTGFQAVVEWMPNCYEFRCDTDSLTIAMGAFASGNHVVNVGLHVRVLDTPDPDSVISFVQPVFFQVQRCTNEPCVSISLPARDNLAPTCRLTLPRGGTGDVSLPLRTGLEVWGAEGSFAVRYPLQVLDVQYAGAAPGTYVTWTREAESVRFVAFTTGNVPMIPVGVTPFLRVRLRVDPGAGREPRAVNLDGGLLLAVGRDGQDLPFCPEPLDLPVPNFLICISDRPDTCDANGDGRADVRDLVRMVACLRPDTTLLDTARVCTDCNKDGHFDLSDLFCCARHILRAPQLPIDSLQTSNDVAVAYGTLRQQGDGWIVPVRITGAEALSGTLLRLRYPSERWRAEFPVSWLDARTEGEAQWMPLVDVEEPGVVQMGWLKIAGGEQSELMFEIVMRPIAGVLPGDALVVEGADLVRSDGVTLKPAEALPVLPLLSPPGPPVLVANLELGPARPNPFNGTTRFSVTLPREHMIELTIHDVAGRAVATLARGRFDAGVREFEWNGAGASDGLYFARLTVNGQVFTQRVAFLRGSR